MMAALPAVALLEFSADGCGFCLASGLIIAKALATHPAVKHLKVEHGSGRALPQSFKIKLWQTLIF
jgi:thioredoxin 1|uniref:thioredoxin family protein n=1 Tax=Polaromonas sp. H6N TaxID=1840293 RepID=UPI00210815EA|nr:thioredoxin family protein [Polaromonas sp. H6N]